jgi:transposase
VNAIPLYRQEQELKRLGLNITRAEMAHWTILCAERYLSILYDYLHEKIYDYLGAAFYTVVLTMERFL